jgi:stage V sporulation protein AC
LKDCTRAFLIGGTICLLAEALRTFYIQVLGIAERDAGTLTSITVIGIAVFLTAIGVFDKIARYAGAGTLVPITGFANAVSSPAIDSHSEGLILGVGAKIFTVAGPVLLYGILSGAVYGMIYWAIRMVTSA